MDARPVKIEARGLHKSFGEKQVLAGTDLAVRSGESVVVIGGSGTGKSVLLKCLIGLLAPDAGEVVIDGQELSRVPSRRRAELRSRFGMLFQGAALFDSLPVWENVGFRLLQHTRKPVREVRAIAEEKLRLVGLPNILDLMPSELSGGMRKRVGLARAIATDPEVLFYDEPTTGLDPIMADAINDLIVRLRSELGMTSIAITHDMTSAYKIADRIAMLYKGRIIAAGTPAEIRGSPDPYVRQFIEGRAEGPITDELRAEGRFDG